MSKTLCDWGFWGKKIREKIMGSTNFNFFTGENRVSLSDLEEVNTSSIEEGE